MKPLPPHLSSTGRVAFRTVEVFLRSLQRYHRFSVEGFERVDHLGEHDAMMVVGNHSLATYDSMLLGVSMYDRWGRFPSPILDRVVLGTPVIGNALREVGFIDGDRESIVASLKAGNMVAVSPGGMRESLRPSTRKRQVDWAGRTGFVRVAMLAGAPIVLAACPRGDDIFDVTESRITQLVYQRTKLPLPLMRGWGPTLMPRPVRLTTHLSAPIPSPVPPDEVTDEAVTAHHAYLTDAMNRFLAETYEQEGA
jgi:1-acyl-sn-glycerol-3-phosphate acyltransferase